MGDPGKQRKKFDKPRRPWDRTRIELEKELLVNFGLRRKKELWRGESLLRNVRRQARDLSAEENEKREKELLDKLKKLGFVDKNAKLEDVLDLDLDKLLERRLQTLVFKKVIANTVKQARQLITHGHIRISGRKVIWPSYLVPMDKEKDITSDMKLEKIKTSKKKSEEKKEGEESGKREKESREEKTKESREESK